MQWRLCDCPDEIGYEKFPDEIGYEKEMVTENKISVYGRQYDLNDSASVEAPLRYPVIFRVIKKLIGAVFEVCFGHP